jgi:hypothetical protein
VKTKPTRADYLDAALRLLRDNETATVASVRREVWGGFRGSDIGRDATRHALAALVRDGELRSVGKEFALPLPVVSDLPSPVQSEGTVPSLAEDMTDFGWELGPQEYVPHDSEPPLRTVDYLADKYAPERVIAEARALAERLPIARERLQKRLAERMIAVTEDRVMLAELDQIAGALAPKEENES